MKTLVTLSCVLLSFTTMACPDLTGNYFCNDISEPYEVQYSQAVVDGATVYTMTHIGGSYDFPADGKKYSESRENLEGNIETREIITSCSADTLTIAYRYLKTDSSGAQVSDDHLKAAISLDSNKNLKVTETFNDGTPVTDVCQRK